MYVRALMRNIYSKRKSKTRFESKLFFLLSADMHVILNDKQYQIHAAAVAVVAAVWMQYLLKDWIIALLLVIMLYDVHRNRITLSNSAKNFPACTIYRSHDLWSLFAPKKISYLFVNFAAYFAVEKCRHVLRQHSFCKFLLLMKKIETFNRFFFSRFS